MGYMRHLSSAAQTPCPYITSRDDAQRIPSHAEASNAARAMHGAGNPQNPTEAASLSNPNHHHTDIQLQNTDTLLLMHWCTGHLQKEPEETKGDQRAFDRIQSKINSCCSLA
jgi:hypothetical protein